jgi:hypothetical protein
VSTADWWAARLRGSAPPPPPAQQYAVTSYPQYPAMPQFVQQAPSPPVQQALNIDEYKAQLAQALRDKRISPEVAAAEWAKLGGGDGTKFEPNGCPQCHGPRYFERRVLRTMNDQLRTMSKAPAPMCMDCGFSGAFIDVQAYANSHPAPASGQ